MKVYIRNISSPKLDSGHMQPVEPIDRVVNGSVAYPKDRRIVRHLRRLRRLVFLGRLLDLEVLHILPSEHDIFVHIV